MGVIRRHTSKPYATMVSLTDRARAAGVSLVRVAYCDNANLIRAKAVPLDELDDALEYGVGFTVAQQALPMMADSVLPASGLAPIGEVWLVPDLATFTALPYSPGCATMLGDFVTAAGVPWEHCPRACLRRAVAAAAAEGVEIYAAFEPEFYLFRPMGTGYEPADRTNFAMTMAHDLAHDFLRDLVDTLNAMQLRVVLLHPESGPGQFEVSIHHAPAVAAADRHIFVRDGVRGVAFRHGTVASFAPKPLTDAAGSGCHLHISFWRGARNLLYDEQRPRRLSREGDAWIAGLLRHLPGLCALTTPSVNSYARLQPHAWAGAFACWGVDHREAAVRLITPRRGPASFNLELKTVDGSANPYLALAGVIAAGLDGLRRGVSAGDPIDEDPADASDAQRAAQGVRALPRSLDQAVEALQDDPVLLDALGAPLARSYLAVRRAESDALSNLPHEEQVRAHLLKY
ncbi:MAG TPA: glutamine synthetase family protein [bacterium]|nr:glutamine synthetase family protein [bacterium]